MIFNNHDSLKDTHAFMGASQNSWLRKNNEQLIQSFFSQFSAQAGTALHELAHDCIESKTMLTINDLNLINITLHKANIPKGTIDGNIALANLIPFVNDAIGFGMNSEIVLYYSIFCYGTTDAILFDEKEKMLRIHDLKTGTIPAHWEQLLIYAALFCLEYKKKPQDLKFELRIYQNCETLIYIPTFEEVEKIMEIIKIDVALLTNIKR